MFINLEIERLRNNETVTEVAMSLGIGRNTYRLKERGVTEFTKSEIDQLLSRYAKTYEELFKEVK